MHATERSAGVLRRPAVIALIAVLGLTAIAVGASAHGDDDHGTLTFHDSEDGPPTDDLQCEFWVKGHGMSHQNATIKIRHDSRPNVHTMTLAEVQGEENENGTYDFEAGPFEWHHHTGDESTQHFRAALEGDHSTAT